MPIVGGLDIHRKQITFDYLDTGPTESRTTSVHTLTDCSGQPPSLVDREQCLGTARNYDDHVDDSPWA